MKHINNPQDAVRQSLPRLPAPLTAMENPWEPRGVGSTRQLFYYLQGLDFYPSDVDSMHVSAATAAHLRLLELWQKRAEGRQKLAKAEIMQRIAARGKPMAFLLDPQQLGCAYGNHFFLGSILIELHCQHVETINAHLTNVMRHHEELSKLFQRFSSSSEANTVVVPFHLQKSCFSCITCKVTWF